MVNEKYPCMFLSPNTIYIPSDKLSEMQLMCWKMKLPKILTQILTQHKKRVTRIRITH